MEEIAMTKKLKINELEQISGGNFFPNVYSDIEYASIGIKVVHHTFDFDDFWWQGENLPWFRANQIMDFAKDNGRQPYTLDEAIDYSISKDHHENIHQWG